MPPATENRIPPISIGGSSATAHRITRYVDPQITYTASNASITCGGVAVAGAGAGDGARATGAAPDGVETDGAATTADMADSMGRRRDQHRPRDSAAGPVQCARCRARILGELCW